jgi:hypothetical protein
MAIPLDELIELIQQRDAQMQSHTSEV